MSDMYNPPHAGLSIRDDILPALGLSVTAAAKQLAVSRATLSRVINGQAAIKPEMALRIEAWLGIERGGDARVWMTMQNAYDLWHVKSRITEIVKKVKPAPQIDLS